MNRDYSKKMIKILFGRATRCAYPDCRESLIFEDRGCLTVNAEIAHIRSGEPGGPRHDPSYPVESINTPENLLLLCPKHHKPVDDHEPIYPIDELLEWKHRQIAEGTGRELSEHQLAQIIQHVERSLAAELAGLTAPQPAVEVVLPPVRIRPGQPRHEAVFQPVYQVAGGTACLGEALGEVYEDELGWVQHFGGGPSGEPAVLCALFGRPVVAVARSVWNEICAIGGGGPNCGTTGVGFPVADQSGGGGFISSESEIVELAGGRWGPSKRGRLVRRPPGAPVWQPKIHFDREASRDRDVWTNPTDKKDLRVRVAARIPLVAEDWRITGAGRERMLAALERSGMAEVVRRLAGRYGIDSNQASWLEIDEPDGHNDSRFTAHQIVVDGADGRPALAICLRLVLPDGRGAELRSTVDLRVDFDAIEPSSTPAKPAEIHVELRLTLSELIDFFARAWHVATMILPLAATDDPLGVPPAGASRLEFYIQTERPDAHGGDRTVRTLDMIDLSALGAPRSAQIRDLAVAVTTPLGLPEPKIESIVNDAMVRMAEDFGFTTAAAAGS